MKEGREIKRSFSIILAEAVTMAEIHKIPGQEGMLLLQCDIRADPIEQMDITCSPNMAELGFTGGYNEHSVWRHVYLHGKLGDTLEERHPKAIHNFSAGCTIFSFSPIMRAWRPFRLCVGVGNIVQTSWVFTYWNGMFDNFPVDKNADNPCADLCALYAISDDVNAEEGDGR